MIRSWCAFAVAASTAAVISTTQSAWSQDDTDQQLGRVHFATSCNEVAQRRFDRAMRFQHSFWYKASKEVFEEALKADPECGIAHWGIALSLWSNPHSPPPGPNLPLALAAIEKAKAVGAKTQRERDYIDALAVLYADYEKIPYGQRLQAHLGAMEALAQRYPQDDEAQIAYAITLNVSAPSADKTYAQQLKGAAILEAVSARHPRHPGVTHYLIHLYDYPPIAEKGLDAARRYAAIAPAAPHAQHMPSHIYTRVGYWKDSIASNIASVRAAKAEKEPDGQLHAMDYMVYAYLQLGQDKNSRALIDEMLAVSGNPNIQAGPFAIAASTARYVVERGDWKGAAELQVRPSRFAHADAMTHFARALGASRSGRPDAAQPDIAKLAELRDKLREAKSAYWAEQIDIQWQVASAWALHAQGKHDDALAAMSAAANAEDKTEKHVVSPGPLAPARELYGAMLLERGMAKAALAAFEATLNKEPNRLGATLGAANAAEKSGDTAKARQYYVAVAAAAEGADPVRNEIAEARNKAQTR